MVVPLQEVRTQEQDLKSPILQGLTLREDRDTSKREAANICRVDREPGLGVIKAW